MPSSSPGQGTPNIGLLGKLKQKVGLNKKKESTVNVSTTGACVNQNESHDNSTVNNVSNESSSDNSIGNNGNIRSSIAYRKETTDNTNSNDSSQNLSEHEYIGQGVLAGRKNDSDMELMVESQKRSHPDSDSVDSVDEASFVVPEALPPRPSKKKPAVVVLPGTVRPVAVDRSSPRDRSRSPKRPPSASRSSTTGTHTLPSSIGFHPKPPRSPRASRGPRGK